MVVVGVRIRDALAVDLALFGGPEEDRVGWEGCGRCW